MTNVVLGSIKTQTVGKGHQFACIIDGVASARVLCNDGNHISRLVLASQIIAVIISLECKIQKL